MYFSHARSRVGRRTHPRDSKRHKKRPKTIKILVDHFSLDSNFNLSKKGFFLDETQVFVPHPTRRVLNPRGLWR
jgi:hypothetical protein